MITKKCRALSIAIFVITGGLDVPSSRCGLDSRADRVHPAGAVTTAEVTDHMRRSGRDGFTFARVGGMLTLCAAS
jgi:hypothetical protein